MVNDAKGGEVIARFYRPERGDVILNPTDDRCAYWNICGEGYDLATYKTVMTSLFPPPVVRDPTAMIFNEWTVSLGAYLLDQFRPDTETLGSWIANYREIERRVQGTIHQYMLPANSPQQRAGVLGTLALAGDPLWMMPPVTEGRGEFCIREWTRDPVGWVFISSDSDTRDALKPLISTWMDLFILGLLSSNTKKRTKLLGLEGAVTMEQFDAIRQAVDPATGEFLRQRQSADRYGLVERNGVEAVEKIQTGRNLYDCTVSAPKALSVLALEDPRILGAHNAGVAAIAEEMEPWPVLVSASWGRTIPGTLQI